MKFTVDMGSGMMGILNMSFRFLHMLQCGPMRGLRLPCCDWKQDHAGLQLTGARKPVLLHGTRIINPKPWMTYTPGSNETTGPNVADRKAMNIADVILYSTCQRHV